MSQTEAEDVRVDSADSLRSWCDVIRERFVALHIAPHHSLDFAGSVQTRRLAHMQAAAVSSAPQTFTRTKRLATTAREGELLAVGLVERGTGYLEQDGRTCVVSDGGFAVYETSRPFTWSMTGDWRLCVYTWPRESIALSDTQSQRITATAVAGAAGVGRFLSPMFADLIRSDTGLSPQGGIRLATEVAEMALIAAGEAKPEKRADLGQDRMREIQVFIEQHVGDPALTPDSIAQEFYMSTRSLHRLFAHCGLTVSAWIKHRRLEACRRALTSPGSRAVPIHEIASRYGFTNQAFFSREFSVQYRVSPRQYRSLNSDDREGNGQA